MIVASDCALWPLLRYQGTLWTDESLARCSVLANVSGAFRSHSFLLSGPCRSPFISPEYSMYRVLQPLSTTGGYLSQMGATAGVY